MKHIPNGGQGEDLPVRTLRQLREQLGGSQSELAEMIGTTQGAVLKTEQATDPRLSTVARHLGGLGRLSGKPVSARLVVSIGDLKAQVAFPEPPANQPGTKAGGADVVWRLRAWDDPLLEHIWQRDDVISMSADEIGDLTLWPGDETVARRLSQALPQRSTQAIGTFLRYWRYFRLEMARGDLVLVPLTARQVAVARVTGDYLYDASQSDERLRHRRTVEWLRTLDRSELDEDIRRVVNAPGTVCRVSAKAAADRLR
jgi:transcriptional regulator with XRE-family HTH domain